MKKLLLFLFVAAIAFVGCDSHDNNGNELVTFGEAFNYCLKNPAYLISSIVLFLALVAYCYYLFIILPRTSDTSVGHIVGLLVVLALFIGVFFGIPNGVHLNTTKEAAKRGNMIGG